VELWRPPTTPIVQSKVTGIPAAPGVVSIPGSPAADRQGVVASVGGYWSGCEVWAVVTADWDPVTLDFVGVQGPSRATLDRKRITDADGVVDTGSGQRQVSLFSSSGRPCSFQVIAYLDGAPHPPATWYMRLWPDCTGNIGDRANRSVVEPFAYTHQQLNAALTLAVGPNGVFPAAADGGRTNITRVALSTDDVAPRIVSLVQTVGGVPTTLANWVIVAGAPIADELTYPLWGARGGDWSMTLSGLTAGATVLANVTGYAT